MVHQKDSENWEEINWKYHNKVVLRLQKRIFKALREKDLARANRLQRLRFNSYSARMIAIRQVTQLNQGKKTAGIDGKKALRTSERLKQNASRNTLRHGNTKDLEKFSSLKRMALKEYLKSLQ